MPAKRPGAVTLTFAKRNKDIRALLDIKKEENPEFVVVDYFCETVRFYEKYKNAPPTSDTDLIKKIVDERLRELGTVTPRDEETLSVVEDIDAETLANRKLEADLNSIAIEDD